MTPELLKEIALQLRIANYLKVKENGIEFYAMQSLEKLEKDLSKEWKTKVSI